MARTLVPTSTQGYEFADGVYLYNRTKLTVDLAAAVAEALHRNYLAACVGAVYPVLFEQPKDGRYFGHAPNYMEVLADGTDLHNQVRNVKVTGTDGASLLGELLED